MARGASAGCEGELAALGLFLGEDAVPHRSLFGGLHRGSDRASDGGREQGGGDNEQGTTTHDASPSRRWAGHGHSSLAKALGKVAHGCCEGAEASLVTTSRPCPIASQCGRQVLELIRG